MKRDTSAALFEKAKQYFPGGVNSPVRAFRAVGGTPVFFKQGSGSKLTDEDGNTYIDYCCSWGPLILGHADKNVVEAICSTAASGTSFGAPTRIENELAALILDNHRYLNRLRFVSSGTEAVMSAIRLARGYTGRDIIIKFEGCYHGHSDALLVKAGSGLVTFGESSSAGIPESFIQHTLVLPLDDRDALTKAFSEHGDRIAAVIIEPVPANNGLLIQEKEYLQFLREITHKHGSLLIFDEVISGFRLGFEGASGYYDIAPDIITFGKIIGGGLPVGAYGAKEDIMQSISPEGPVYQAGTLSGNPVAMAAGLAQLKRCLEPGFYSTLSAMNTKLCGAINNFADDQGIAFRMVSLASMFWPVFSTETIRSASAIDPAGMDKFRVMHAALLEQGVYLGPSGYEVGFVSAAHTEQDIQQTIAAFSKALLRVFEPKSA